MSNFLLKNPDIVPLLELDRQIRGAAADARRGSLKLEQLSGGTAVLSNLGGWNISSFNALLTPPHSTALSLGSIERRIVVGEDGTFGARLLCTAGLTADHRSADGADAARFIGTLRDVIADPARLGAVEEAPAGRKHSGRTPTGWAPATTWRSSCPATPARSLTSSS